jgi:branched-chain amino acid transport system permease protein
VDVVSYWESVFVEAAATLIVALGLNLQLGYAGIYLAAPAVLYGVGAYIAALTAIHLTSSFIIVVLVSIGGSVAMGAAFGVVASRIKGEYFIIASMALGFVLTGIANQLSFLGGSEGLVAIPVNTVFGIQLIGNQTFAIVGLICAIIAVALFAVIVNSTAGRRWRAVMSDEAAARSLGLHPTRLRIGASAVSGVFFGLAGAIYAANLQYVTGADFSTNETFLLIVAIVVGGAGTVTGPILGSLIVIGITGVLTNINFSPGLAGVLPEIVYGAILVVILIGAPSGLVRLRFDRGLRARWRDNRAMKPRDRLETAIGKLPNDPDVDSQPPDTDPAGGEA